MYSEEISPICSLCRHSQPVPGILTHVKCTVDGGYMPLSRPGCQHYSYDIFKRPVRRNKGRLSKKIQGFSKEDFTL